MTILVEKDRFQKSLGEWCV